MGDCVRQLAEGEAGPEANADTPCKVRVGMRKRSVEVVSGVPNWPWQRLKLRAAQVCPGNLADEYLDGGSGPQVISSLRLTCIPWQRIGSGGTDAALGQQPDSMLTARSACPESLRLRWVDLATDIHAEFARRHIDEIMQMASCVEQSQRLPAYLAAASATTFRCYVVCSLEHDATLLVLRQTRSCWLHLIAVESPLIAPITMVAFCALVCRDWTGFRCWYKCHGPRGNGLQS